MSTKLRREKDIISRVVSDYQTAATTQYARFLEGTPTYVTYYQLQAPSSTIDNSLETVHSMTNSNSPNKYRKIFDFPLYGLSGMDIENALTEAGLKSEIEIDLIVLPASIIPTTSDFVCFDGVIGMENELFEIVDVAFDRVHANKYYKISLRLYPENSEEILGNCIDEEFVFDINGNNGEASGTGAEDGTAGGSIISVNASEIKSSAESVYDALLDKYQKFFYDPEVDEFVYRTYDDHRRQLNYWSPYLQKFLYESKLLKRYNAEIMTEFYVRDINSWDYGEEVFNDYCWDHCIYQRALTADEYDGWKSSIRDEFIEISDFDLRKPKTLPFYFAQANYKMLNFDTGLMFLGNAFPFKYDIFNEYKNKVEFTGRKLFKLIDGDESSDYPIDYDFHGELDVKKEDFEPEIIDSENNGIYISLFGEDEVESSDLIEKLAKDILYGKPLDFEYGVNTIDDDKVDEGIRRSALLTKLNKYQFRKSLKLYILMPIVLYGLKSAISKLS